MMDTATTIEHCSIDCIVHMHSRVRILARRFAHLFSIIVPAAVVDGSRPVMIIPVPP